VISGKKNRRKKEFSNDSAETREIERKTVLTMGKGIKEGHLDQKRSPSFDLKRVRGKGSKGKPMRPNSFFLPVPARREKKRTQRGNKGTNWGKAAVRDPYRKKPVYFNYERIRPKDRS